MFIKKTAWRAVSALLLTLVSFALCCTGCEVDASDSPAKVVTVTFDANASDAKGTTGTIIGKEKALVSIPECEFTRDGWTFASWNTAADGSGESYKAGDSFVLKEDLTLYAQWTKNQEQVNPDEPETPAVKTYTITFDTDGGSDVKSATLKENETLTKPENPTKEGFDFVSWIIAKEGETEVEKGAEFDFSTKITKDYTLKASWTVKKCTIYIDTDGGNEVDPIVVDYGHVITTVDEINSIMSSICDATKYGYLSTGYYAKSGETEIELKDLSTKGITTDIYIKILWELRKFLVSFDADNGSVITNQSIEYKKYATVPADPKKEGYTFKGWYRVTKKIEGEEQVKVISDTPFDFKNTAVTEQIELKALYTLNSYTVTFNPNNGSDATSSKYDYNSFVKKPSDPVREGYKFAGWYQVTVKAEGETNVETISDTPFDFENSVVKSEITLKALWKVEIDSNIEVTLEKISGDDNMHIVVETDEDDMPKTFAATEGYDLYAWYLDGEQMKLSSAKIDFDDFVACVNEMVQNGELEAIEEGGKLMLKGGHHRLQVLAQKNGESFPHSALFDYFITYSALN